MRPAIVVPIVLMSVPSISMPIVSDSEIAPTASKGDALAGDPTRPAIVVPVLLLRSGAGDGCIAPGWDIAVADGSDSPMPG